MRARRITFFALMAAMLIVLWYTGEAIYFWVVVFQLCLLGIAGLNLVSTFFGLKIYQTVEPRRCEKGDVATLRLTVANETVLPFAHTTLVYDTLETYFRGGGERVSVSLLPRRSETLDCPVNCLYRGVYPLGFKAIELVDLFGLFRLKVPFERLSYVRPAELVVRPQVRGLLGGAMLNREMEANTGAKNRLNEDLSAIESMRAYRPGDPLKRVHWKLTARTGETILKEFEGSVTSDHAVFVDCSGHGLSGEEAAALEDVICECAATFCLRLVADFERVRLITFAEERRELGGASPADFELMREWLARIRFTGEFHMDLALDAERAAPGGIRSLMLVTHAPSNRLFEQLIALSEEGCKVSLVVALAGGPFDERMVKMLGEFAMRGIDAITIFPGEDAAQRLGVLA